MSIASDEAERYYPNQYWPGHEPSDDYPAGKLRYLDGVTTQDLQEVYEIGRTAEPTDAEIAAGAKALWLFEHQDSYPTKELLHKSFEQAWQLDVVSADYCERSECLLKAARKAVSE